MLVRIAEAARALGVTQSTVRRWEKTGKLQAAERTPGGQRMYDLANLHQLVKRRPVSIADTRVTVGYARVSTSEQRHDLSRQITMLESYCAAQGWPCEIIADTGSGMNYQKHGLRTLIRRIASGELNRLVLTDRDRLLRFGSELVFGLCSQFNVEVVIINVANQPSYEEELASDVLEILTVFAARMYGARSRRNKRLLTDLQQAATAHGNSATGSTASPTADSPDATLTSLLAITLPTAPGQPRPRRSTPTTPISPHSATTPPLPADPTR
jgi:predicted site-specific integrase-resolvase